MSTARSVPCNGCTLCCVNDLIVLHPECGDDAGSYITTAAFNPITGKPVLALAKQPGSNRCIYLGDAGCTIHDRAPVICKEFDCGGLYLRFDRATRRRVVRSGLGSAAVFEQGRRVTLLRQEDT